MGDETEYVFFVRGAPHAALCAQAVASIKRADPFARIFVYQEFGSALPVAEGVVNCITPAGLPLQLAKISAQCRHVMTASPGRQIIFLDTDTLVLRSLDIPVGADLFVTWRRSVHKPGSEEAVEGVAATMPYNAGVWGVRAGVMASEILLWIRERVRLRQGSGEINAWFSDQTALAELCGAPPAESNGDTPLWVRAAIPWLYHAHGEPITILKLPCSTWNYSPPEPDEDLKGKGILHFKGKHRPLLEGYARALGILVEGAAEAAAEEAGIVR
jgi:hypothetical protein